MKLFKVADFNSKEFGDHFKNNEKYTEKPRRNPGILSIRKSGNLVGAHTIFVAFQKLFHMKRLVNHNVFTEWKVQREGGAADHGPDPDHQPDTNINIKNQGTSTKTVLLWFSDYF